MKLIAKPTGITHNTNAVTIVEIENSSEANERFLNKTLPAKKLGFINTVIAPAVMPSIAADTEKNAR